MAFFFLKEVIILLNFYHVFKEKNMKLKPKVVAPTTWFLIPFPSKRNHSTLRNDGFHGWDRKYKMSLKRLKPVRLWSKEMGGCYKDMEDGSSHWPNLGRFQHQNVIINTEWIMKHENINPKAHTNNKDINTCIPTYIHREEKGTPAHRRTQSATWQLWRECRVRKPSICNIMVKTGSGENYEWLLNSGGDLGEEQNIHMV